MPDGVVIGRGRGRGRGRVRPQTSDAEASSQTSFCTAVSGTDEVDNAMLQRIRDFGDRYDDNLPKIETLEVSDPKTPRQAINGTKVDIPEDLFDRDGKATVEVSAVNFEEKCATVKFQKEDVVRKCKVHLGDNLISAKWKLQNSLVLKIDSLIENATLSTLELHLDKPLVMHRFQNGSDEDEYLHLSVDLLGTKVLSEDFVSAVRFFLVPRLPAINSRKLATITNLRGNGELDIQFYDQVALSLRQALRNFQTERQIFSPQCLVSAKLFKELIEGFDAKLFLAPLNEDWTDLHRVSVVGVDCTSEVKVLYLDIGKKVTIRLNNLVGPLTAVSVPEMLEKIPPQAVTVKVDKMDSKFDDVLKSMRIEGRICYVQTIDDSEGMIPRVNIFLNNDMQLGSVSLFDLANSYVNKTDVAANIAFKPESLKAISKKQEGLTKAWQESVLSDPKFNVLRNGNDFNLPSLSKSASRNSIFHKGLHLFNNLPNEAKLESNIDKFKVLVAAYVKSMY